MVSSSRATQRTKRSKSRSNAGGVVPQPHGGALVPGGGRGPVKGARNAGRIPSAIRDAYRMAAAERLDFVRDVVDGKIEDVSVGDRLKAWDLRNRYGGMLTIEVTEAPKQVTFDLRARPCRLAGGSWCRRTATMCASGRMCEAVVCSPLF